MQYVVHVGTILQLCYEKPRKAVGINKGFYTLFVIPTDAHYYKVIGMLKQLKSRQLLQHVSVHVGTIIRESFNV
jgi:hypothetical protein